MAELATKTTLELRPGGRLLLGGRAVRTVEWVETWLYRNGSPVLNNLNQQIYVVRYTERGGCGKWSGHNGGVAETEWTLADQLEGYHATEAEFPELRELPTFSAEWYRKWRDLHLAKYPDSDVSTRTNLDMFVEWAKRRETKDPPE